MSNIQAPSRQVRIQTLATALNVCPAQLRHWVKAGKVPRSDHYQHGTPSYWHLETIRAWRPDVALACETVQSVLMLKAAA